MNNPEAPGVPAARRGARISLAILGLIAALSIFGPMASPHPYDRVYRDFLLAEPSLAAHPTQEEALRALEDIAQRLRLSVSGAGVDAGVMRATLVGEKPIDPRILRAFERSDVFFDPKLAGIADEGRRISVETRVNRLVFLFGTDANGRDLLTRVLIAGRVSLSVGLLASLVALVMGVAYGALAGYAGGWIDGLMMRIVEVVYALPFIFFVIVLVMIFGRQFALIFVAIGAVEWLDMARIVRGQTLSIMRRDYVAAAEALGAGGPAIIRRHVIPNIAGPIIAYLALLVPRVILLESFVSFLGFGVQEPLTSWGALIADGARNIQSAPYLLLVPAAFLGATLGALQVLGDSWRLSLGADGAGEREALYKI